LPIAFHLTGGEASDSRNFETLLDIGPDLNPRAALGDKGYDSKSNQRRPIILRGRPPISAPMPGELCRPDKTDCDEPVIKPPLRR
jgi:Transposase DDE domain